MNGRILLVGGVMLVVAHSASGQSRSSSSSGSSSSGSSSAGFSGQVGGQSGFRSNTSGFGRPSSLLTGNSSSNSQGTDAFGSTRQDALSMNRATGGSNQGRNSSGRNSNQFSGMNGGGRNSMNNFNQNAQQNVKRTQMSAQIAFEVPTLDAKAVVAAAQSPLSTRVMPSGVGVNVQVRDGVAMLTGSVPSKRDAILAAAVVSLEPGIRTVDNRLVVAPATITK